MAIRQDDMPVSARVRFEGKRTSWLVRTAPASWATEAGAQRKVERLAARGWMAEVTPA